MLDDFLKAENGKGYVCVSGGVGDVKKGQRQGSHPRLVRRGSRLPQHTRRHTAIHRPRDNEQEARTLGGRKKKKKKKRKKPAQNANLEDA